MFELSSRDFWDEKCSPFVHDLLSDLKSPWAIYFPRLAHLRWNYQLICHVQPALFMVGRNETNRIFPLLSLSFSFPEYRVSRAKAHSSLLVYEYPSHVTFHLKARSVQNMSCVWRAPLSIHFHNKDGVGALALWLCSQIGFCLLLPTLPLVRQVWPIAVKIANSFGP